MKQNEGRELQFLNQKELCRCIYIFVVVLVGGVFQALIIKFMQAEINVAEGKKQVYTVQNS